MAKSKAMSKEKKHVGFHPKNFACRRSVRKVLASVLWIKDRAIYTDYVQQAKSITTEYYCFLLTKLQAKIVETRLGKLSKGVLFLQDNTPAPKSPVAPQEINESVLKVSTIQYILLILFNSRKSEGDEDYVKRGDDRRSRHLIC
jgi:hypothetical protein